MAGICVMTLTRKNFHIFILIFFVSSCGTIKEYVGLSDEDVEKELISSTPELVLPPDFGKKAIKSRDMDKRKNNSSSNQLMSYVPDMQSVQPKVTNFFAPELYLQSSKTPSESLEKFKLNKKFTIGEWVYGQYVQGYKEGNIYYKPVYDKGYNFSRRYIPDQNVNSFRVPPQNPVGYNTPMGNTQPQFNNLESNIENFGDLPILE